MHRPIPRRLLLRAGAASVAAAALPASAAVCEFFALTLRVIHPWCRETPQSEGVAIVGMVFEDVARDDRLIGVETPVAEGAEVVPGSGRVELAIPAGRVTTIDEQSPRQLRLLRLAQGLEVGRSYPLTLEFEHGGRVNTILEVDYARFG